MPDAGYTEAQKEYREVYLRSDHWREVRKGALARADHRCQVCNGADQLDVHHRTYERKGCEEPGDLTVLCRKCHEVFHGVSKVAKPRKEKRKKNGGSRNREDRRNSPFRAKQKRRPAPVTVTYKDGTTKQFHSQRDLERDANGRKKKKMAEPAARQPWEPK